MPTLPGCEEDVKTPGSPGLALGAPQKARLEKAESAVHAAADLGIHGHRLYFISDTVP